MLVSSLGFLAAALLALGNPASVPAGEPLLPPFAMAGAAQDSRQAPAVARIVQSLMDYSRWPETRSPAQLCVAGPAFHSGRLDTLKLADGRPVVRRNVPASPIALAGCDVAYLGQLPLPTQRQLVAAVRGRGVLTIAEADPGCRSQAMFCLTYSAQAVGFRLNVDAVSRSGLRVDPRVLRLSAGQP